MNLAPLLVPGPRQGRWELNSSVMRTASGKPLPAIARSKVRVVRVLTVASSLIACVNTYSFWILVSTWAVGLVWWAELLHLVAPVAAMFGLGMALWRPRQPVAAVVNGAVIVLHGLFVLAFVVA